MFICLSSLSSANLNNLTSISPRNLDPIKDNSYNGPNDTIPIEFSKTEPAGNELVINEPALNDSLSNVTISNKSPVNDTFSNEPNDTFNEPIIDISPNEPIINYPLNDNIFIDIEDNAIIDINDNAPKRRRLDKDINVIESINFTSPIEHTINEHTINEPINEPIIHTTPIEHTINEPINEPIIHTTTIEHTINDTTSNEFIDTDKLVSDTIVMFDPEFNFASRIVTKITPELLKSIMLTICREISATSESINERNISGIISRHIGYTKTGDFNLIKIFCLNFNSYHYERLFPGRSYQLTSGYYGPEIVNDNPN